MSVYHLDFASYALNILGFDEEQKAEIKDFIEGRLSTDTRKHDAEIVISDIALAETVSKIYMSLNTQARLTDYPDYLYKLYRILSKLDPNYLPIKHEAIKAYNFLATDEYLLKDLGPHDLLILSQAVSDKTSDYIFTIDNQLLSYFYNKTVSEAIEQFHAEKILRVSTIIEAP